MTPLHLRVTRCPSLYGAIDTAPNGYVVTVSDGVLAMAWTGTRSTVDDAVALMTRIFVERLVVK